MRRRLRRRLIHLFSFLRSCARSELREICTKRLGIHSHKKWVCSGGRARPVPLDLGCSKNHPSSHRSDRVLDHREKERNIRGSGEAATSNISLSLSAGPKPGQDDAKPGPPSSIKTQLQGTGYVPIPFFVMLLVPGTPRPSPLRRPCTRCPAPRRPSGARAPARPCPAGWAR